MAITKPKPKPTPSADAFIAAAPDAGKPKGVRRGRMRQISLTIAPELLARIDELAAGLSLSRAAVITLALNRAADEGLVSRGVDR